MRILWLSNKIQSNVDSGTTGTWLDAMAQLLVKSGEVELGNIALGPVARTTRQDCGPIQQWVVPAKAKPQLNGLPAQRFVEEITRAVYEFNPDLVHVWGTECFWGLLTARRIIRYPALLEMQGLKGIIARVFDGGLSIREQLACIGLKEVIRGCTIFQSRRRFEKWGVFEKEMIRGHRFVTTQSEWLCAHIVSINPSCRVFHNDFMLRESFYTALPWKASNSMAVFCSAAYPSPFKGLHVALRAIAILKQRFPGVQLRIAGAHQRSDIRQDGYVRWLNHQIARLGIADNVCWLGALSAEEIVAELQGCAAIVVPSFIEGYCLGLAEGMMLGVPSVNSFAGGMSSLAKDEESALFFQPGDAEMCAHQLGRLLTDRALAERLSHNARAIALVRNDPQRILQKQLEIYQQVIAESNKR
ncbi:MAG: glycosyltransferase [Candidatus Bilamarchaeaceae archaeon]